MPTSLALVLAFAVVFETRTPDADSGTDTTGRATCTCSQLDVSRDKACVRDSTKAPSSSSRRPLHFSGWADSMDSSAPETPPPTPRGAWHAATRSRPTAQGRQNLLTRKENSPPGTPCRSQSWLPKFLCYQFSGSVADTHPRGPPAERAPPSASAASKPPPRARCGSVSLERFPFCPRVSAPPPHPRPCGPRRRAGDHHFSPLKDGA